MRRWPSIRTRTSPASRSALQMLRDGRRADREMRADRAGAALARAEQLDDPRRVGSAKAANSAHAAYIKD